MICDMGLRVEGIGIRVLHGRGFGQFLQPDGQRRMRRDFSPDAYIGQSVEVLLSECYVEIREGVFRSTGGVSLTFERVVGLVRGDLSPRSASFPAFQDESCIVRLALGHPRENDRPSLQSGGEGRQLHGQG